jgi:predicted DsbA family dithiol-disulfide isomerase
MLLEQLFAAYFYDGLDIGNTTTLYKIAKRCGFSPELIKNLLIQDHQDFISASTGGNSVPYFIFDRASALVGAQSADTLYQAMHEALVVQGELM